MACATYRRHNRPDYAVIWVLEINMEQVKLFGNNGSNDAGITGEHSVGLRGGDRGTAYYPGVR